MKAAAFPFKEREAPASPTVPDFNRLAPFYRWMEWFTFGPFLWQCRLAFLPEMRCSKSALILGDGDGRFTAQLLTDNPQIEIHAIDASDAMLRQLVRRAGPNAARVRTQLGDAREVRFPTAGFDLVATHFFLDCLTTDEVNALAARIRLAMTPHSTWVVSEFATPATLFGKLIASPLVSALYLAFRILTGLAIRRLPDHPKALREAGFVLSNRRTWLAGLLVSETWRPLQINTPPPD